MKKMPPVQKVFEAWSALCDNRVQMEAHTARVASSDGSKDYLVIWDKDTYSSNDNATYWQGYAGYPVLAVLMLQKRLPYNQDLVVKFSKIPWNSLNKQYKRDYAAAAEAAFQQAGLTAEEKEEAKKEAQITCTVLSQLPLTLKRKGRPAQKK